MNRAPIALLALSLSSTAQAAAGPPVKPQHEAAVKLLRAALPNRSGIQVQQILDDAGGGRFPVLFTYRTVTAAGQDGPDRPGYSSDFPCVALLDYGKKGLQVSGTVELPVEEKPADTSGATEWGQTSEKDHDLDGKPEMTVLYSYFGAQKTEMSGTRHKHLAVLNLDKLGLAFGQLLEREPEDSALDRIQSRYRFVPRTGETGAAPDIALDVETSSASGKPNADDGRHHEHALVTYRWNPKADAWQKLDEKKQ